MAEGGEINLDLFGEDGYDKDGFDEYGKDRDGNQGYNEDGYDINGFDKYGYDKDGKTFEQGEGEHIPLLKRTSTSRGRETQRPFKPRERTSTRKEVSFENPSFRFSDDRFEIEETPYDIDKLFHLTDKQEKFKKKIRADVKKLFPRMKKSVQVKKIDEIFYVKLPKDKNWKPIFNLNGKRSLQFNKELKKALGFKRDEIIKINNEQNLEDLTRLEELENNMDREDISEEVKNTTINEINELKEGIDERNKENEELQNQSSLKERIKEIFKKYGFTITAVVSSVSVVIGVIVSNLSSGLSSMAKGVANGLKDIGGKLAQILPGMIGAIASFIFKTAGEVLGFLAENAWILVVAVVVYLVESLKKKRTR